MSNFDFLTLSNGSSAPLASVPELSESAFRSALLNAVNTGGRRIMSFFALPQTENSFRLIAVLGNPAEHRLEVCSASTGGTCRSLTPEAPAFQLFEREIYEQYGIVPQGHPWLKPVRRPATEFFRMTGDATHEVAVGPVHAGVIEPGHFRFQCVGEEVYFLEIALGYQHRGIEKLLENGPDKLTLHRVESAAGDSSVAAAAAYSHVVEALAGVEPRNVGIRAVALELERLANHIGDLGALAGDVAFLPTASFCGRIRGEYLNMTAELCGNRFGRGVVVPGGVRTALEAPRAAKILSWLRRVYPELVAALKLMFDSPTVLDRLENTGSVEKSAALRIGMVGVAARGCGVEMDARRDFPLIRYAPGTAPAVSAAGNRGDVMARAQVRFDEIIASHEWLFAALEQPEDPATPPPALPTLKPGHIAVAAVEAWRGELCYTGVTGADGRFRRLKIVDPSFHNWSGLALALRGEQISNFPICNKSFNLSYCGHDL